MLFLASLVASVEWVGGMCYTEVPDATPRSIIFQFQSTSREACKQQGLTVTNSESVYFSPTKKICYFLEKPGNGTCGSPFARDKKTTAGCIQVNPTVNYVTDYCFDSPAVTTPGELQAENAPICPNIPIDGEATARVYFSFRSSLILPGGQYIVLDNNLQAIITWDATNTTWRYKSENGGTVYVNEPIYAASCAYFPAGTTSTTCPCDPLPLESTTKGESGAIPPTGDDSGACPSGYSGIFIQAKSNQTYTCSPCSDFKLQCIGGLWIHTIETGTGMNSFAISNGTCYQPTASAK